MTLAKVIRIKDAIKNFFDRTSRLIFVVETNDWIIKWVGEQVVGALNKSGLIRGRTATIAFGLKNKIVHFGSINSFTKNGLGKIKPENKAVVSWFHVVPDDERLKHIGYLNEKAALVLTSCQTTKNLLVKNGLRPEKIAVVALGTDLNVFKVFSAEERAAWKKKLGLSAGKIIIGSFQKDGNGWGKGLEPKLIKGPDVFCDTVERLAKKYPVEVLLTGPARGYVKNRLTAAGIPFKHFYFKDRREAANYYNCLDLYIIASRVEGGPESLSESWACGVPVVSTRMGMSADWIRDGENGFLAEVEDAAGLAEAAEKIIIDKNLREKIIAGSLADAKKLDWKILAREYYEKIYKNF